MSHADADRVATSHAHATIQLEQRLTVHSCELAARGRVWRPTNHLGSG